MKIWCIYLIFILLLCFFSISCNKSDDSKQIPLPGKNVTFASKNEIISYLNTILENNSDPEVLLQTAEISFDWGEIITAQKCLEKYFRAGGHSPDAYNLSGNISLYQGDSRSAIKYAWIAQSKGLSNYDQYNLLANAYFIEKKYDSSYWAVNISLSKYPDNPESNAMMGKVLLEKNDTAKSIEYFKKAFTLNPSNRASEFMIDIYSAKGDWNKAVGIIEKQLLKSDNIPLKKTLVNLFIKMQNFHGADSLIRIFPDEGYLSFKQLTYAKLFYIRYWYDSSIIYADKVLAGDNLNKEALFVKGKSLERKNLNYEALQEFNRILSFDSADVVTRQEIEYLNRKIAYLRKIQEEYDSRPVIKFLEPIKRTN